MKRFVAILTTAVLVLAMSAGPAFAYTCSGDACCTGPGCAPTATPSCQPAFIPACPMTGGGQAVTNTGCMHGDRHEPLSTTIVQADEGPVAVSVSAVAFPGARLLAALHCEGFAPDARGAPHLTTVIRI
jgi:hypothetical protein